MAVATKPDDAMWTPPDETTTAQLDRALDLLDALLKLVPVSAFAWPAEQETFHAAAALLAEAGRAVPDERAVKIAEWLASRDRP